MEQLHHPKWTNLKIFPELAIIKKETGLINDIIESYNSKISVVVQSKHELNLNPFDESNPDLMVYSDTVYHGSCDILIAPPGGDYEFYWKTQFGDKFIYLNKF
jgi:hypothetical protein